MDAILQTPNRTPEKKGVLRLQAIFSYYRVVITSFLPLAHADMGRVLPMMSQLYAQDALAWDENRSRHALEDLLATPDSGATWLMSVNGETVGYLVLTICFSLEFHGRYALLDEFFVKEEWRGQSIGSQAPDFVEEQCVMQGVVAVRLEADRKNDRALALYRRRGFEAHDRYLMTKWLPRPLLK